MIVYMLLCLCGYNCHPEACFLCRGTSHDCSGLSSSKARTIFRRIDRNSVSEGCREVFILMFIGIDGVCGCKFSRFPCIQRSFTTNVCFRLFPDQIAEFARDSGLLDESVSDIDVELKSDRELVIHQTS